MATKNRTSIILNGKHYDARTGEPLAADEVLKATRHVDDVIKPRAKHPSSSAPAKKVAKAAPHSAKVMDVQRGTQHVARHQPQRSATLVRSVNRPAPSLKSHLHASNPVATTSAVSLATVTPKWPVSQVTPQHLKLAKHVARSKQVQKFAPVKYDPRAAASIPVAASSATPPADEPEHHDIFEKAIASATSHLEPAYNYKKADREARKITRRAQKARRPARHRVLSSVTASMAVLVLAGSIAYANKTPLTLRFADAKAGFHATLPTYQPDGFSVDDLRYSVGNFGASYRSGSGRSYSLEQQSTQWDDQDLLSNFVAVNYHSYQVLRSGSRLVYIYGHNDASWLANGFWYKLDSGGALSTSQVLNIANSI